MTGLQNIVYCNGCQPSDIHSSQTFATQVDNLQYKSAPGDSGNLTVKLAQFVSSVEHISDRLLDLIEIGAYTYGIDRLISRGSKDSISFRSWRRNIGVGLRVRDYDFWSQQSNVDALNDAVRWVSGDEDWKYYFAAGHSTPATSLFDQPGVSEPSGEGSVCLFSGGLDSLTGLLQLLKDTTGPVFAISHQSSPSSKMTQKRLIGAINQRFEGRVVHIPFECHLSIVRATEETQRTRSFLFATIACVVAATLKIDKIHIFENGVTSLNLPKREGMDFSRASRTTHPFSISKLNKIIGLVTNSSVKIETPFFWLTKADVVERCLALGGEDLIDSAVSCTRTFKAGQATQCGECSQCVDRRFACSAAGASNIDHSGLYALDFTTEEVPAEEGRTFILGHLNQATRLLSMNSDSFYEEYVSELTTIVDHVGIQSNLDAVTKLFDLLTRHAGQVMKGLKVMRDLYDDPSMPVVPKSLFDMVNARYHLLRPGEVMAMEMSEVFRDQIPILFRSQKCENEGDLNDKIESITKQYFGRMSREKQASEFWRAKTVPDHAQLNNSVLYEAKYVRGSLTPSKLTDQLAADLVKYPQESYLMFIIYDPESLIIERSALAKELRKVRPCFVCFVP